MSSNIKTTATKEEATPALVPKLRFPEFRDAEGWDEKAFGELLDDIIDFRGRTPIKLGMDWGSGNITSLSANNVKNGFIDYKAECNLGSEELYQRWMGDVNLEKDDIVFTMEAPLGNALLLPDSRKYILSQRVVAFKTNSEVRNPFLVQLIWSEGFQDAINELATGSTAKGINQKALKTILVPVPRPPEQQEIAECLSSVDELIAAQARKLDALKTHKKGLMQQLFPREGETQPRLRFTNKGEWVAVGLPEVAFFQEGPGIMAVDFRDEGVPLVRLAGVSGSVVTLVGCNYLDPEKVSQKWSHFRLAINDLIISTSATFGLSAKVTEAAEGAVFYTGLIRFRPSSKRLKLDYLKVFLGSPYFARQAESAAVGGGIKHFGPSHLKQMEIPIPPVEEQQRIADCLTSLDDLIAAQTQKDEALKTHKKGLMQQLFPSPDELS